MGPDSTHTDAANAPSGSKRQARTATAHTNHRKRVRLTPTGSSASDPSFPDESAMAPKRVPDGSTDAGHADSESESELEESSDEPSSDSESDEDSGEELQPESEDEEGIVNVKVPVKSKPDMRLPKDELGPDLRPFLESFLPRLKAANEALERERRAGTLKEKVLDDQEALDAQDQYIEMDLGLGVLEEQDPNTKVTSSLRESEDNDTYKQNKTKPSDVLSKLMGRWPKSDSVDIQEVGDVQT